MTVPIDTDPDVQARYRALLMARSASDRIVMAAGMFDTARAVMLGALPDGLSAPERRVELFIRTYGRDLDRETVDRVVARLREQVRR